MAQGEMHPAEGKILWTCHVQYRAVGYGVFHDMIYMTAHYNSHMIYFPPCVKAIGITQLLRYTVRTDLKILVNPEHDRKAGLAWRDNVQTFPKFEQL